MSRSSRSIWSDCLENSGLPPCPEDVNEPQWVALALGKHCLVCHILLKLQRMLKKNPPGVRKSSHPTLGLGCTSTSLLALFPPTILDQASPRVQCPISSRLPHPFPPLSN